MADDVPTAFPTVTAALATRPIFVGVDVGGTGIKLGLVDRQGRTIHRERIATEQEKGPQDAMDRIASSLRRMVDQTRGLSPEDIQGVGLATPGTHDIPAGMILTPFNMPAWRNFPVRDALQQAYGKPVTYANDANAAAYGEYWAGSGQGTHSMVMLTLGTGVGGGIIIGDISIDGCHSHGGELGHIVLDYRPDARLCPCGGRGHLEAYASATAIVLRVKERLADATDPPDSSLRDRLAAGAELTTRLLAEEAEKGDAFSWEVIREAAEFVGTGIVTVTHAIDPSMVVLGGAVNFGGQESELGRRFLRAVQDTFASRALPPFAEHTRIAFASLGGDAGCIGAAGLACVAHQKK